MITLLYIYIIGGLLTFLILEVQIRRYLAERDFPPQKPVLTIGDYFGFVIMAILWPIVWPYGICVVVLCFLSMSEEL
jgi:hypothetical protein